MASDDMDCAVSLVLADLRSMVRAKAGCGDITGQLLTVDGGQSVAL